MTLYEVRLEDGSGRLKALWFNQPYLRETPGPREAGRALRLVEPDAIRLAPAHDGLARVRDLRGRRGRRASTPAASCPSTRSSARSPARPCGASWPASPSELPAGLADPLPEDVRERLGVVPRREALRRVHHPGEGDDSRPPERAPAARATCGSSSRSSSSSSSASPRRRSGLRGEPQGHRLRGHGDGAREAVKRVLPFPLTGRPEAGAARDRRRHALAPPHEPPRAGRRGLGQDPGGASSPWSSRWRTATRPPSWPPPRSWPSSTSSPSAACWRAAPYRVELLTSAVKGKERAATLARDRLGGGADRRRHPRPHPGGRRVPAPGPGGGRRAAPLRRAAARGPAEEGLRRRRAGDDGHAHPAHPGPHRLRRPRRLGGRREAAGPHPDPDPAAGGRGAARRARPRAARGGAGRARPTSSTRSSRSRRSSRT